MAEHRVMSEALLASALQVDKMQRIATRLSKNRHADQRAAFWVGAVVADDVAHLARHPILQARPTVWVGGRQPLRELYARLLGQRYDRPVRMLDDEIAETASALGAVAVAGRHWKTRGVGS